MACLITSACAQVEFTGPKRQYAIDNQTDSENEMHLKELTKIKKDPMHWGTLHFSSSDPAKDDITVDLGKEKYDYRPSRYFARTNLPEIDGKSLGLTLSVDSKRDAWMGVEFKIKTDFWSPSGALK
jgi:hypothetical protein